MANIGTIDAEIRVDTSKMTKGMNTATRKFKKVSTDISRQAKIMSTVIVTAFAGIGAKTIKMASDFEETQAKFDTAFKGIEDRAEQTAKSLSDDFNLSSRASKMLLSDTGDLLKGFGFTANAALDLSNKTQELAADLASYNNIQGGTERASRILTSAMLGERESLKQLGIKILETDVNQRLMKKGQEDLTGQALLAAKAQATFELAVKQSGDAIGDTARTSDSFANQMRKLRANSEDLAVSLGGKLLPTANKIITTINKIDFSELIQNETVKRIAKAVAGFAGLVAILGGVATAIALVSNPLVQFGVLSGVVAKLFKDNFGGLRTVFSKVGEWITQLIGRWTKFTTSLKADTIQQDIDALDMAADRFSKIKTNNASEIRKLIQAFSGDEAVEKQALDILNKNTKSGLFGDKIEEKHIREIAELYKGRKSALKEEKQAALGAFEEIKDMTFKEIGELEIKETADKLKEIGKGLGKDLTSGVTDGLATIADAIGLSVKELANVLKIEIPEKIKNIPMPSGFSQAGITGGTGSKIATKHIDPKMPSGFSQAGITGGTGEKQGDVSLKGFERAKDMLSQVSDKTKQAGASFVEILGPVASGIKDMVTGDIIGGLLKITAQSRQFGSFMEKLAPILQKVANIVGAVVVPVLEMLIPPFEYLVDVFKKAIKLTLKFSIFILKGVKLILGAFEGLINGILWLVDQIPFVDVGRVNLTHDTQQGIDKLEGVLKDLDSNNQDSAKETTDAVKQLNANLFNLSGAVNTDVMRARALQGININVSLENGTSAKATMTTSGGGSMMRVNPMTGTRV